MQKNIVEKITRANFIKNFKEIFACKIIQHCLPGVRTFFITKGGKNKEYLLYILKRNSITIQAIEYLEQEKKEWILIMLWHNSYFITQEDFLKIKQEGKLIESSTAYQLEFEKIEEYKFEKIEDIVEKIKLN